MSTTVEASALAGTPTPPVRPKPQSLRAAWPALVALCLAMLVEMVDNTVLQIALPTIARDLHAGTTDLQWVTAAYSLTFGGLLLVAGTLGDMFGRRRSLLIGLGAFGLVSLGVLVIDAAWQLVAIRALLGVAAAFMAPATMSLTFRLFDDDKLRSRAIGLVVTVAMIGFAIGPVLSGLAVEHMSWHVLLLLNAPVALIAVLGVAWGIPADEKSDLRTGSLDVVGALFSVTTLGVGLYAFTSGVQNGWGSAATLGCFAVAIASAIGFYLRERSAADPMVDLHLLARPTIRGSAIIQTAVMLAMVGTMYGTSQQFQFAWGWSPVKAGFANLPFVIAMFAASPLADKLIATIGQRKTSVFGGSMAVLGLVIMTYAVSQNFVAIAAATMVLVVGVRCTMSSAAIALMGDLPEDQTSFGAALNDTVQELGNSIGVAIIGTVMGVIVGINLPGGQWPHALVDDFIRAEQVSFAIMAAVVACFVGLGARSLTDSKVTEEH